MSEFVLEMSTFLFSTSLETRHCLMAQSVIDWSSWFYNSRLFL